MFGQASSLPHRFGRAENTAVGTILTRRFRIGVSPPTMPRQPLNGLVQHLRKAGSIRKKTSLSSWLHGVACRVSVKLKREHARRKNREHRVDGPAQRDPAAEVTWREVQAILDEELEQLPERYRTPVILCYLD